MGDYSRNTFDVKKHYSGVLQQQGRVQVDADWNEQLAIRQHRDFTEASDVIGVCGAPLHDAGFGITASPDNQDLLLSNGRMYVGGLLCESDGGAAALTFTQAGQPLPPNQVIAAPGGPAFTVGEWAVISAVGVPELTVRITAVANGILTLSQDVSAFQNAANPRLRPVTTYLTQPDYLNPDFVAAATADAGPRLTLPLGAYVVYLDAWQREITALDDPRIRETALGGPDTAARLKTVWQVRILPVKRPDTGAVISCASVFPEWTALVAEPTGLLNARTQAPQSPLTPCLPPPTSGYRALENQLYRVQVHTGGGRDAATFKWSRDNASVESTVEDITGNQITVASIGRDDILGFGNGQWIELVDPQSDLNSTPHPLLQIDTVDPASRKLTMKNAVGIAQVSGMKARRWDQSGAADGVPMSASWIDLEGGVQVTFSDGTYRSGDFWLIPARVATGEIEWPPFQVPNTSPLPQPPAGVRHRFCRLALLDVGDGRFQIQDCRRLFRPISEPEPGIRVTAINLNSGAPLRNDTEIAPNLLASGLRFFLDAPADPRSIRGKPVCIVTVYLPFPLTPVDREIWGDGQMGSTALTLDADLVSEGVNLFWTPSKAAQTWLTDKLAQVLQQMKRNPRIQVRLTLKGRFIWAQSDNSLFLDGFASGLAASGGTTGVALPSGKGRPGSDLEMWFWLNAPPPPAFKVAGVRVLHAIPTAPAPVVLGILAIPPGALTVPFTAANAPNAVEVQFTAPVDQGSVILNNTFVISVQQGPGAIQGGFTFSPDGMTMTFATATAAGAISGFQPGFYVVTMRGTGVPAAITSKGVALDGEPTQFPSGNGVPGGDFTFSLRVG